MVGENPYLPLLSMPVILLFLHFSRFLKVALQILLFNFVLCLRRLNLFEHNIIICDPEGKAC